MAGRTLEIAFALGAKFAGSFNATMASADAKLAALSEKSSKINTALARREHEKRVKAFRKSAEDVSKNFGSLKSAVKGTVLPIVGVVGGATAAMMALATKTAEHADKAGKNAMQVGMGVRAYTELAHVANMAGVNQEAFTASGIKLNNTIADAAKGSKTALAAFKAAGVNVHDTAGKLKRPNQVLMEIAAQFQKMPDGPQKTALAMDLFGKSGAALIPMLNDGAEAMRAGRLEAKALGLSIGKVDFQAGQEFADNVSRLKFAAQGLALSVGKQLMPMLSPLIVQITDWMKANQGLISSKAQEFVAKLNERLPEFIGYAKSAASTIASLVEKADSFATSMGGWDVLIGRVVKAWLAFRAAKVGWNAFATAKSVAGLTKKAWASLPDEAKKNMAKAGIQAGKAGLTGVKGFAGGVAKLGPQLAKLSGGAMKTLGGGVAKLATMFMGAIPAIVSFGAALLANPITWIVAGIIAVGVGVYMLIKHWDKVKAALVASWEWIAEKAAAVWGWIKETVVGAFNKVVGFFTEKIDNVKAIFKDGFLNGLIKIFSEFNPALWVMEKINGLIQKLTGVDLASVITNMLPEWARKGLGLTVAAKASASTDLPKYATGAFVTKPQIAQIGEKGREFVIPVDNNKGRGRQLVNQAASLLGMGSGSSISAPFAPQIHVSGGGGDVRAAIDAALREAEQRYRQMLEGLMRQSARVGFST